MVILEQSFPDSCFFAFLKVEIKNNFAFPKVFRIFVP